MCTKTEGSIIDAIFELSSISLSSVRRNITEDWQMRRVAAKFIPRLLTVDQKQTRVNAARDLLDSLEIDGDFFCKIITGDESWCYEYGPETKKPFKQRKSTQSPRPKKARQVKSAVKTMIIRFLTFAAIVHSKYVPEGQTVN